MSSSRKVLEYDTTEPSRLFRTKRTSGQSFEIRQPEMIQVGKTTARILVGTDSETSEKWHDASMLLMETVESLDDPLSQAKV